MTPVMQTRFGHEIGNCLAACVVSMLDVPELLDELSDVLERAEGWTDQRRLLARWLRPYGLTCVPMLPWDDCCEEFVRGVMCLASGISPRAVGHGVVWMDGLEHDPHPEGGGLRDGPQEYTVIVPLGSPKKTEYKPAGSGGG